LHKEEIVEIKITIYYNVEELKKEKVREN